jgi:hypothetical protein
MKLARQGLLYFTTTNDWIRSCCDELFLDIYYVELSESRGGIAVLDYYG